MLTYDEYQMLGGVCDLTAFNRIIDRANGLVNNATFGRIANMCEIPRQVKACLRDLVEYLDKNISNPAVTSRSQSAGGVSESESYTVKTTADINADVQIIIYDYLMSVCDDNGTPLLYRGCMK